METESQRQVQKFGIFSILGVFLILFIGRVLFGSGSSFLNVDELELIRSTSDRLLGVPQTSLAWPGTTIQMILVPFVFFLAGVRVLDSRSTSGLADFLADFIYGTEDYTIFFRFVLLAIMASISVKIYSVQKSDQQKVAVIAAFLVLFSSPIFAYQSALVTGDALAAVLVLSSLMLLLHRPFDQKLLVFGAISFGAAVGCRATFVLFVPILAYFVVSVSRESGVNSKRQLGLFAGATLLAVLFFLPALWMDPIRLFKSILGNAGRAGEAFSFVGRLGHSIAQIGIWSIVFGIAATFWLKFGDRTRVLVLFGYALLLLLLINRLGVLYDRYYLMIVPLLGAAILMVVRQFFEEKAVRSLRLVLVSGLAVFVPVVGVISINDRSTLSQLDSVEPELKSLSRGTVLEMDVLLANEVDMRIFDRASLLAAINQIEDGSQASVITNKLGAETGRSTFGLPFAFVEDEMAMAARLRVLAHSSRTGDISFKFFGKGVFEERYGVGQVEDMTAGRTVLAFESELGEGWRPPRMLLSLTNPLFLYTSH